MLSKRSVYVTNTLCIRPTRYEYVQNWKKNINSSAYASVLHTFWYLAIRWLKHQGVTGPLSKFPSNALVLKMHIGWFMKSKNSSCPKILGSEVTNYHQTSKLPTLRAILFQAYNTFFWHIPILGWCIGNWQLPQSLPKIIINKTIRVTCTK